MGLDRGRGRLQLRREQSGTKPVVELAALGLALVMLLRRTRRTDRK